MPVMKIKSDKKKGHPIKQLILEASWDTDGIPNKNANST
jgi:hypothetical protein